MSIQSFTPATRAELLNGAPLWLQAGEDPVYAVLHSPSPADHRNTAVLILPPFGWEEVCSYRSRRHWATELARAGFPTARIDLPATGDSGGCPTDADMLDRWDLSVHAAVDWLRGLAGISRVAVIGIRLGGLLAMRALAAGAQVDDVVLWGVPARGRAYLRELRVHSEVVASGYEEHDSQVNSDGTLALTGFVLKPATVASLEAVDLAALPLPDLGGRRALLIERDGLGVDRKLNAALSGAGAETQTLPATDYRLMMTGPLEPGTPRESIAKTIDWISAAAGPADWTDDPSSLRLAQPLEETTTMVVNGVRLSERLLSYDGRAGTMVGVLTRPADHEPLLPVCVVLLGAGRRIGPNRMWVETARRWAALGVQSVRFDIEGLGDSDGNGDVMNVGKDLYAPRMAGNVKELIDRLDEMGIADRFVMVGLCSSAYWSFRAAVDEPRIVGTTLVNQWAFDYNERLVVERARARTGQVLRKGMLKRTVKGVWKGRIGKSELRRTVRAFRPGARHAGSEEAAQHQSVQTWLSALAAHGTDVAMIFSMAEPLYEQILRFGYTDRTAEWPNLFVEQAPIGDHNIRALGAQALISDRVDAAIRRQLALESGR